MLSLNFVNCIRYGAIGPPPGGSFFGGRNLRSVSLFLKTHVFAKNMLSLNVVNCIKYGAIGPPP